MRAPTPAVPPAATLRALLGRDVPTHELGDHLSDAVRALADPQADWFDPEAPVVSDAERLSSQYRDERWTWRR